jgi:glycosyltransferase involved in cell wall biosynthesis
MKKKILIIITKGEVGGAQMSVLNLARELTRQGHKVEVGFGEGEFLSRELERESIPCHRFKNLKRTHNPLNPLLLAREVRRFIREHHFDAVHINSSNALPASLGAKTAGRPLRTVFTFRGMSLLDDNYRKNSWLSVGYRLFFRFFLRYIDSSVFVSRDNLEKAERGGWAKNGHLIYNGLDEGRIDLLAREEATREIFSRIGASPKDPFLIGSIGRLAYQKNYEFLVNVFPRVLEIKPNALAVIIGEGPEQEKLARLIEEKDLGDKVILFGRRDNASSLLKAFDLFVLPSRYEGLSITLIETLFAGVPVLASDVGGNRETLPDPGELYALDDEDDFLAKLRGLLGEDKRSGISAAHKKAAQDFRIQETAQEYEKLY